MPSAAGGLGTKTSGDDHELLLRLITPCSIISFSLSRMAGRRSGATRYVRDVIGTSSFVCTRT
ncbi:MAG: hypothetical protein VXX04_03720, partial [Actinomycetota bacterium]|nr:hypothetical protein [Actinomycetota bacterium]